MNENGGKSNSILLTVIGIATLLVVVVGATFAYFAATATGDSNASSILITAGQGGSIVVEGGEAITLTGIYPKGTGDTVTDAWATQKFKVTYPKTTDAADQLQNIEIKLNVVKNNFKAGYLKVILRKVAVTNFTVGTNYAESLMAVPTSGDTTILTGTRQQNAATTIEYTLEVYFPNIASENQNDVSEDKMATFNLVEASTI